jgi:hypothetical protein
MIVMLAAPSRPKWMPLVQQMKPAGITPGMFLNPHTWRTPWLEYYALDNGCFVNSHTPFWWEMKGEKEWLKMLDKAAIQNIKPLFAILPDIVGDWDATVKRSSLYLPHLADHGIPTAIALQDGADFSAPILSQCSWWFVGGSTNWKWSNAEIICQRAKERGKKVHVGRVNGEKRIRECLRIGADSCDGTGWTSFTNAMMPRLYAAYKPKIQGVLEL